MHTYKKLYVKSATFFVQGDGEMKKELGYFTIEGEVGGNQDWFRNLVMKMGGCAAATACDSCIYFAIYHEKKHLYPFDAGALTKEEYIQFAMKMKPYIPPRVNGVKKLSMYIEGFQNYLRDAGEKSLSMEAFSGEHTWEEAAAFVRHQMDAGCPVPYLLLKHTDEKFKDFTWHWFLLFGYEETEDDLLVTAATYGEATVLSLKELWNTGMEEKGGMIAYVSDIDECGIIR